MKKGKLEIGYVLVIAVLLGNIILNGFAYEERDNFDFISLPKNNQQLSESAEEMNQKIISHTLLNSSKKTWNLYRSFSKGFSFSTDNFSNIIDLSVPNYNFLSASIFAYLNLSIFTEVESKATLYHAFPLINDTKFTLGKSVDMLTNFGFILEGGYTIEGSIGNINFNKEFFFLKDGNWSYQFPTDKWEFSLFDIPVLGDLIGELLSFDFTFNINAGDFSSSFHGFIYFEPKIVCRTIYSTETFIEKNSVGKCILTNPAEVKLMDIEFQKPPHKNNITLEEELDCILESQLVLDSKFGYDYFAELDLSNPLFEFLPSISFGKTSNIILSSKKIAMNLINIQFQPYTIDIVEIEPPYISKNLLEQTIIETPLIFPVFNLTFSNIFNFFLPFPLDGNISLEINAGILLNLETIHRIQLISPRIANTNDTIDLFLIPLSGKSNISMDLKYDLCFATETSLMENITINDQKFYSGTMDIPLGIATTDIRKHISSFIPEVYKKTSITFDLSLISEYTQLTLDLAPILLSDQSLFLMFNSTDFLPTESLIHLANENQNTSIEIIQGTIYDQLKGDLIGSGSLQVNSTLQPRLYFKTNLLTKTLSIPLPVGSSFEFPIANNELNETLISKCVYIPTYFIDKDDIAPVLVDFSRVWKILNWTENEKSYLIRETQSGIKSVDVKSVDSIFDYFVENNGLTIIIKRLSLETERRSSGTLNIELNDNKGNQKSYELEIYYEKPYIPYENNNTNSDITYFIVFLSSAIIISVVILFQKNRKRS